MAHSFGEASGIAHKDSSRAGFLEKYLNMLFKVSAPIMDFLVPEPQTSTKKK